MDEVREADMGTKALYPRVFIVGNNFDLVTAAGSSSQPLQWLAAEPAGGSQRASLLGRSCSVWPSAPGRFSPGGAAHRPCRTRHPTALGR